MDRLTALLDGPRARGAFVLRCLLRPPWSMLIRDGAPLTVCVATRGGAWLSSGDAVVHLPAGSAAIVRGPDHYTVSDAPAAPGTPTRAPDVIIHPGQRCETPDGRSLTTSMRLGVRTWGDSLDAPSALITGTYENHSAISADLLGSLPPFFVVPRPSDDPLVGLLTAEITGEAPGQQALLDRLLDVLVIDTLRRWCEEQDGGATSWWHAHQDPLVGSALTLIHDAPEHRWTIDGLAREVGTSRANLARRFTELVGEPPIGYLTRWRLSLAADLLCQGASTVAGVALAVGYASPFALSTAFKKRYGVSPQQYRTQARDALETQHPTARPGVPVGP